jgi:hypothetical protein
MKKPELLSRDAEQSPARLIGEMARLYFLSRAIQVAAELGVADRLGDSTVTVAVLANSTKTKAETLRRLLHFLSNFPPIALNRLMLPPCSESRAPQMARGALNRVPVTLLSGRFFRSRVDLVEICWQFGCETLLIFLTPIFRIVSKQIRKPEKHGSCEPNSRKSSHIG